MPNWNAATWDEQGRKLCCRCKEFKSPSEYYRNLANKSGIGSYCKPCHSRYAAERVKNDPDQYERSLKSRRASMNRMYHARKADPNATAPPRPEPTLIYQEPPVNEDRIRWRTFFGERWGFQRYKLWTRYQMTPDEYISIWNAQGGACAICKRESPDRHPKGTVWFLSVDHCHATGKVRGLLCRNCNSGCGVFHNDPERMERAAEYVRRCL